MMLTKPIGNFAAAVFSQAGINAMGSKYRAGQQFTTKSGKQVEVIRVDRSIHGNTSRIVISIDGIEVKRPVRTAWLTELISR